MRRNKKLQTAISRSRGIIQPSSSANQRLVELAGVLDCRLSRARRRAAGSSMRVVTIASAFALGSAGFKVPRMICSPTVASATLPCWSERLELAVGNLPPGGHEEVCLRERQQKQEGEPVPDCAAGPSRHRATLAPGIRWSRGGRQLISSVHYDGAGLFLDELQSGRPGVHTQRCRLRRNSPSSTRIASGSRMWR